MLSPLVFIVLTTTTIVISQSSPNNDVALIVNGVQPKSNVTCLCTEDEVCEGNTRTCTLRQPDQTCYESWTLDAQDNSIRVTAGYVTFLNSLSISFLINIDAFTMITSSYDYGVI